MPFTAGFESHDILVEKFAKHGAEFGVATPDEYLQLADTFLGGPLNPGTTWECVRENGDHLRYNTETEEFGVLRPDGVIKTYFKPDPADHRQSNNVEYFRKACRQ